MFKNFKHPIETTLKNISELEGKDADVKKLMRSFALDMIGNVVFSLKTNSFKENDFADRVMNLFKIRKVLILLAFVLPDSFARFFSLTSLRKDAIDYFVKLTISIIEQRKREKKGKG